MKQETKMWLLNKAEQTYLKLLVHNCSTSEMEIFLGVKKTELEVFERQIIKKLHVQTS